MSLKAEQKVMDLSRNCELTKRAFTVSANEAEFCRRNDIPLPRQHPIERIRNLLAFRNRVFLTTDVCKLTGQKMFSCVPPSKNFTVCDVDAWESDSWDALAYGRDYDFQRPFFEQFRELFQSTPIPNLAVIRSTMENSDYTNGITGAKNCYLLFGGLYNEDCMFSFFVNNSRDVLDCVAVKNCELCYDCQNVTNCYNLKHSDHCYNCSDSSLLSNCHSCKSCFGCVNLTNKENYFFNKPLSKDEYKKAIQSFDLGSRRGLEEASKEFSVFKRQFPTKHLWGKFSEQSTGDHLNETLRCRNSYFLNSAEDVEYGVTLQGAKNSFFYTSFGDGSELIYNSQSCGGKTYNLKFCGECWSGAQDLEYCYFTGQSTSNCFGCVGLKRRSYCIFNKQYSKPEYEETVQRIKAHMRATGEYGQFFPPSLSPFFYNRSDASFYLPASKDYVVPLGYSWENEEEIKSAPVEIVPDNIKDVPDAICTSTLNCAETGKAFKILRQELEFYRRMQIPLPIKAPLTRIIERGLAALEIRELVQTACRSCKQELETARDSPSGVLCESCYQSNCF